MIGSLRRLVGITIALTALVTGASCGGSDNNPYGAVGAPCSNNAQCPTGHCCTENFCGGMCTYRCNKDVDCPGGMGCDKHECLFGCRGNVDCAQGQTCKAGGVCEYP